ncbi:hypothetical protein AYI68_g1556 [Smittium mucronatum]|uniref:Uncharacterized protein n=1 Tax=Smittium mucronatum TaxID=133383 RepID=A0A1R0H589_9FUNG|nr:hypothetical protein AYI68_g1556 [Smittium mucronatum]
MSSSEIVFHNNQYPILLPSEMDALNGASNLLPSLSNSLQNEFDGIPRDQILEEIPNPQNDIKSQTDKIRELLENSIFENDKGDEMNSSDNQDDEWVYDLVEDDEIEYENVQDDEWVLGLADDDEMGYENVQGDEWMYNLAGDDDTEHGNLKGDEWVYNLAGDDETEHGNIQGDEWVLGLADDDDDEIGYKNIQDDEAFYDDSQECEEEYENDKVDQKIYENFQDCENMCEINQADEIGYEDSNESEEMYDLTEDPDSDGIVVKVSPQQLLSLLDHTIPKKNEHDYLDFLSQDKNVPDDMDILNSTPLYEYDLDCDQEDQYDCEHEHGFDGYDMDKSSGNINYRDVDIESFKTRPDVAISQSQAGGINFNQYKNSYYYSNNDFPIPENDYHNKGRYKYTRNNYLDFENEMLKHHQDYLNQKRNNQRHYSKNYGQFYNFNNFEKEKNENQINEHALKITIDVSNPKQVKQDLDNSSDENVLEGFAIESVHKPRPDIIYRHQENYRRYNHQDFEEASTGSRKGNDASYYLYNHEIHYPIINARVF